MKFAVATAITLALAMGVQSSIIPLAHSHLAEVAGHGLSYTAISSPVDVLAHGHVLAHAPAAVAAYESPAWHGDWLGDVHGDWHGDWRGDWHNDWNHGAHLGAVVVDDSHLHAYAPHAHVLHAHEGQYIAKTRGAVHTAPLAGHIASAAAINVAPAPGTI